MSFLKSFGATSLLAALLLSPVSAQSTAVIETIEFNHVSPELRKAVLDQIGVRAGDALSSEACQRIGSELRKLDKGMTFTYRPGAKPGTTKLIISGDC